MSMAPWKKYDYVDAYLRSGGTVTPEFWLSLDNTERATFIDASNAIRCEGAVLIAKALQDPEVVAIEYDGGTSLVNRELRAAAQSMCRQSEKEPQI